MSHRQYSIDAELPLRSIFQVLVRTIKSHFILRSFDSQALLVKTKGAET